MGLFSKLFGSEKKGTTYNGTKPVTSLSQVQGGKNYYDEIMRRMGGQGVGFGQSYANKYANPIVANMRNQFNAYQMPELKSELSASGRRKGSGGFDQIRRAYQEQGLAEGDIFSRLQQRNEDQMRNEINAAVGQVGDYARGEAGLVADRAAFDYQDHNRQVQEADARRKAQAAGYQNLLTAGADLMMEQAPFSRQPNIATVPNYGFYPQPQGYYQNQANPLSKGFSNMAQAIMKKMMGRG